MGVGVVNAKVTAMDPEKLWEWLNSLPEIVREKEQSSVLAFVFFVEMLNEKEKEGKSNA